MLLEKLLVRQAAVEGVPGAVENHAAPLQLVDEARRTHPLVLLGEARRVLRLPAHAVEAVLHGPVQLAAGGRQVQAEEPGASVAEAVADRRSDRPGARGEGEDLLPRDDLGVPRVLFRVEPTAAQPFEDVVRGVDRAARLVGRDDDRQRGDDNPVPVEARRARRPARLAA